MYPGQISIRCEKDKRDDVEKTQGKEEMEVLAGISMKTDFFLTALPWLAQRYQKAVSQGYDSLLKDLPFPSFFHVCRLSE